MCAAGGGGGARGRGARADLAVEGGEERLFKLFDDRYPPVLVSTEIKRVRKEVDEFDSLPNEDPVKLIR